ncbi:tyrosine-protein phosphatase non-receptor type substrate 1 isoform X6 [Ictidomys tridecemlineatus]
MTPALQLPTADLADARDIRKKDRDSLGWVFHGETPSSPLGLSPQPRPMEPAGPAPGRLGPLLCLLLAASCAWSDKSANWNIFIVVGVVCALLVVLLMAALYLLRIKQKKAKGSTSSTRLHEPEKNARDITQVQSLIQDTNDINDITYADLNLPKEKKPAPRAAEPNNHTEYASIETSPPSRPEDTLTYADLDMVHLNRGPKQPAPKPEPSFSEYASVQVQRK